MVRNFESWSLITYGVPHTTLPEPASEIIITSKSGSAENWSVRRTNDPARRANFAPSLSHVPNGTGFHGVIVWSQRTLSLRNYRGQIIAQACTLTTGAEWSS